jgi:monoamine oxidase
MQSSRRKLPPGDLVSLAISGTWPVENTSNIQIPVIGAGVAGLAAARELNRKHMAPVVLEARDRVGGRVLTVHDPLTAVPIELGAEFVHGVHPDLWRLLREMRVPVVELGGEHWSRDSGGSHPANSEWEEIGRVFEAMSRAPEQSFGDFIAGVSASEDAKRAATAYVEGFNAARKEQVSVAWLNQEDEASDQIDGDRSFRILAGYDSVAHHLARDLDVRLSTEVTEIRWNPGDVLLSTSRGSIRAKKAIVAVPLAVLHHGGLRITPEPTSLSAAQNAIATGNALRITFRFGDAKWAKAAPHISFMHGGSDFPVWWTAYPVNTPVITGWAAGPNADALAGRSESELKQIAIESLRKLLGEDPGEVEAAWVHDWSRDPLALGAYSYVRAGGVSAAEALRNPVENTIYFAGEALAGGHMGTVHGAIQSGIFAAKCAAAESQYSFR